MKMVFLQAELSHEGHYHSSDKLIGTALLFWLKSPPPGNARFLPESHCAS